MANPDIEVRVDPRAGEDPVEWGRRRLDRLVHRDGLQFGMGGQRAVEGAEERPALPLVVFPGVLPVQDDRHHGFGAAGARRKPPACLDDPANKVGSRGGGIPGRVGKANQVRQHVIPEEAGHFPAACSDRVGPVQDLWLLEVSVPVARQAGAEGAREDRLVGGHPLEARLCGQRDDGVRHRALRRPQPDRPPAEALFVVDGGALQLRRRVFRMAEALPRHPGVRMRPQVDVGVTDQRQDRMVEGRRGDLDLTPGGGLRVLGHDPAEDLEFHLAQNLFVLFREPSALGKQSFDPRVSVHPERIDPGQLVPDLQVAEVALRQRLDRRAVAAGLLAAAQQLGVAGVRLDHPAARRVEEVGEDEPLVLVGQLDGRLQAKRQGTVVRLVGRKRLELHEQ